ncbi:MAG: phospho-N-acetylmuramoyl-pentapeptide-transferase [Planctomycetes bacterium]|nr:phospho-N-acetylmuramoyl-pentapeptide-transferase [Planctomycetota bacterium]
MLYELFRWLNEAHGFPYLVRYPSFRMAAAFVTAFLACLLVGPRFLAMLGRRRLGENVAKMGDERRAIVPEGKAGTPTMGGILTFGAIFGASVLWARLDVPIVILALVVFVVATAIGYLDDHVKQHHATKHGINGKLKLALLSLLVIAVAITLREFVWAPGSTHGGDEIEVLLLPFAKDLSLPLGGIAFCGLAWLVICGSANAVNLTDGMDGLAAGCLAITGIALTVACNVVGTEELASRFFVRYVPGCLELAVVVAGLVGAALGFLWFNAAPAQVFMGDVGSLGFGALLGYTAFASRMELLLVVAGGVFVAEAMSVILQVASFKLRGKRIFRCAPIHHAFQLNGTPETRIVVRFWIIGVLLAVLSVALFKVR